MRNSHLTPVDHNYPVQSATGCALMNIDLLTSDLADIHSNHVTDTFVEFQVTLDLLFNVPKNFKIQILIYPKWHILRIHE